MRGSGKIKADKAGDRMVRWVSRKGQGRAGWMVAEMGRLQGCTGGTRLSRTQRLYTRVGKGGTGDDFGGWWYHW